MNTETMRSSFENTYKHRPLGRFLAGDYKAASTQQLWMCWQAAVDVCKQGAEDNPNVGTVGHIDHGLVIKDLEKLRQFYTREGAENLIKQHWPDLLDNQPKLTVRLQSFPESNGKRNWTAMLMRVDKWDGLIGNCGGITVAHGELWNRVAYEAERTKLLIGERDTEPHILDYGDDITTPEQWAGEVRGGRAIEASGVKVKQ